MTQNILLETAIEFIRRDRKHAQLAQLIAQAVPELRGRIQRSIREGVVRELQQFCDRSEWDLENRWGGRPKRFERLRLYKKGHWSERRNGGVWFMWVGWIDRERPFWGVGVEAHQAGAPGLSEEELRAEFPPGAAGPSQGGWFYGKPAGDWSEPDSLLVKTDDEIRDFVEATSHLMKRLAGVIDRADAT